MNHELIKDTLAEIGKQVCEKVYHSLKTQSIEARSAVHKEGEDDTIYQIDKDVEDILVPMLEAKAQELGGMILLAEGIGEDAKGIVLPQGFSREKAAIRVIIDPIDGTRNIMYDKRSAFFLSAVAPNKGENTSLQDVEVAVMTELPNSRGYVSDTLWAIKGKGAHGFSRNLLTGEITKKEITPSKSKTIVGGFAQIARFFPPGRDILAKIEDELIDMIIPDYPEGKTVVFEDQYICSGGQMYEILMGHDRFIADVRGVLFQKFKREGKRVGHVCHPYDVACILIGQEAGIIFTNAEGNILNPPLDLLSDVDWVGYANKHIQAEVQDKFMSLLKKYDLIK
jgi:fructose-1,6-bisphosphatase/inositol monophosphatase family enzyme